MRPGLVAIGACFLLLAVVSGLATWLVPTAPVDHQVSTEIPSTTVAPNESRQALLYGTNSSDGSFDLQWQSTGPLTTQLYRTAGCATTGASCLRTSLAASWTGNLSGTFRESGHLGYPYLLSWTNAGHGGVGFQAHAVAHAISHPPLPSLTVLVSAVASAALGVVGAAALLLGLFLRRGVYAGPAPLVSHGPDDVEAVAAEPGTDPVTDPRRDRSGDGSGRPPPAPPALGR